jgi:hypothetical protein
MYCGQIRCDYAFRPFDCFFTRDPDGNRVEFQGTDAAKM